MLSVANKAFMLSVVMLSVIMLNVVMQSVVMLSVAAPLNIAAIFVGIKAAGRDSKLSYDDLTNIKSWVS